MFIARQSRSELTTTILSEGQVRDLVEKMLKTTGRRVDLSTPFVDAMLPDGSRLHVVIPDITRKHWSVNIRKFLLSAGSLEELVGLGTLTPQARRFLEAAIVAGLNIIVSGGTQAGKTTLLNCLAGAIPGRERVVTRKEVFELAKAGLHQSSGRRAAPCASPASDQAAALPSQVAVIVQHDDVGSDREGSSLIGGHPAAECPPGVGGMERRVGRTGGPAERSRPATARPGRWASDRARSDRPGTSPG